MQTTNLHGALLNWRDKVQDTINGRDPGPRTDIDRAAMIIVYGLLRVSYQLAISSKYIKPVISKVITSYKYLRVIAVGAKL